MDARSAAPPPHLARNEALLRAKALQEIDKGARFLEQRIEHLFGGLAGSLLNPLAGMAFRTVGRDEILRRSRRQLDQVIAAARTHGERPEAIFDGHLSAYLEHDEAWVRANRRHHRFQELDGLVREVYVARVEPVSMLLHKGLGDTYPDLVRSVFPQRIAAQQVLEREFLYLDRMFHMADEEPALLHLPPVVGREVLHVLRDTYQWYRAGMAEGLDRIYAA